MKYMQRNAMIMLTIFLFVAACSNGERIKEIDDVDSADLKKYTRTYVGNNSDVIALVKSLPGGETVQSISLKNENIKVKYGAKGKLTKDMIETYWFDEKDTMKKNFFFNTIYLAVLVPNAKSYAFQVGNKSFTMKREEVLSILYKEFADFPKNEDVWDKNKVVKFLKNNDEKMKMIVNDKDVRKALFVKYPVE
ncbi:TPA: DUF4825 domain-containing protein [Bacillus luti]|nr:DUF4825 domain-containing protein [Bacillus luti]